MVDCFVCERKHRAFKTHVAPHHNNLARLSKDCLLQLVDLELRSPMPENALEPQLRGAESARPDLAERFAVREAVFAAGASSRGRQIAKGEVLILSPSTAVEVTGAVRVDAGIMLLVERLDSADLNLNAAGHGRSRWLRRRGTPCARCPWRMPSSSSALPSCGKKPCAVRSTCGCCCDCMLHRDVHNPRAFRSTYLRRR